MLYVKRRISSITATAVAAAVLLPTASPLVTAAHADPPPWAPAHGWRAHHGGDDDRDDDQGRRPHTPRNDGDYFRREAARRAYDQAHQQAEHRQQTKNTWRNVAIAAAAAGIYGAVKHNRTLAIAGALGTLYAANRYEQDRRSQSRDARARADLWGHRYIDYDGRRYQRRTVYRGGHPYWQFVPIRR